MTTIPKPIRDAYTLADVTGMNSLEKSDLTFLIHALGNVGSSEMVQAIYESCNNDGSRGITLEEFGAWWHSYPHKQIYNAFVAADDDDSNSLEEHELDVLIKKLGCALSEDELEEAFDACDSDGFGGVSLQEFGEWSGGKTTHINKFITRLRWQMKMAVGVWARRSLLPLSEISVTTSLTKSFEEFMTCVTKINRETSH